MKSKVVEGLGCRVRLCLGERDKDRVCLQFEACVDIGPRFHEE